METEIKICNICKLKMDVEDHSEFGVLIYTCPKCGSTEWTSTPNTIKPIITEDQNIPKLDKQSLIFDFVHKLDIRVNFQNAYIWEDAPIEIDGEVAVIVVHKFFNPYAIIPNLENDLGYYEFLWNAGKEKEEMKFGVSPYVKLINALNEIGVKWKKYAHNKEDDDHGWSHQMYNGIIFHVMTATPDMEDLKDLLKHKKSHKII